MDAVGSSRPSRSGGGLRAVLGVPAYRRLWAARTVSQWGDVAAAVALGLLVLHLTGTGLDVTTVVAAEILPVQLTTAGGFARQIQDELDRHHAGHP